MRLYTRIVSSGLQVPEWLSEMSHGVQPICYHQVRPMALPHRFGVPSTKVDKHGFSSLELAPIKLSHRILSLPGRLPMTPPATESCVPTPKAPV